MKTRNGKIARLPRAVREAINERLERCEASPSLLAWLNALPEVRDLAQREFDGEPVSRSNLSHWRRGGYQEWLLRRDFHADALLAGDVMAEPEMAKPRALADSAAAVLAARFGSLLTRWNGEHNQDFEARAKVLNAVCRGVVQLQKEAHRIPAPSQSVAVCSTDNVIAKP